MKRKLEERASPIMGQVAALQASINQYEQINSVMPQLQAEVSTLRWLYSVLNKGEQQMAAMGQNIPRRAKGGLMELAGGPEESKQVDYVQLNSIAGNPSHPQHSAVRRAREVIDVGEQIQQRGRRRTENNADPAAMDE